MKELYRKLLSLTGKPYGLYKSLSQKTWNLGDFDLEFIHIQGDPYAPASKILLTAPFSCLGLQPQFINSFTKRLATSDFLLRRLSQAIEEWNPKDQPVFTVMKPGQEVILRNALWIENGKVQVCLQIKLPGNHRIIDANEATNLLTSVLPDILTSSLYDFGGQFLETLQKHIECLEIREALKEQLKPSGLIAFIPNGAILPRASGLSDEPLLEAIRFQSPLDMECSFDVLGQTISGMGIPKGITVISGGAYHGKSTVLNALEKAVYPHIPGDGREWIVIDETATRIHSEEGRSVRESDISFLVRDLPFGIKTDRFSTASASGSTSEAANLLEAAEFGATTFLIDEDSSAVNFLIRDPRVRALIGSEREPLIPLIDRIVTLKKHGLNFLLVAGACGDYLQVADQVILVNNYLPENATAKAKLINEQNPPLSKLAEEENVVLPLHFSESRSFLTYIQPLLPHVRPSSPVERQVKIKMKGDTCLQIGFLLSETNKIAGFCNTSQRFGAGYILLNLLQNATEEPSFELIQKWCAQIQNVGFRKLPQGFSRDLSLPRTQEIAATLLRLRHYSKEQSSAK